MGQGLIRFSSQFQPTQCNYRPSGELRPWRRRRQRLFFDLGNVGFWMIIRLRWWVLKSMAIAHESPQIIVTVFDSNLCGLLGGGSKIWFGVTVPSCGRVHQFINPSWPSDSFGLWDCQQNPMSSCQIAGSVSTKWVSHVCDGLAGHLPLWQLWTLGLPTKPDVQLSNRWQYSPMISSTALSQWTAKQKNYINMWARTHHESWWRIDPSLVFGTRWVGCRVEYTNLRLERLWFFWV